MWIRRKEWNALCSEVRELKDRIDRQSSEVNSRLSVGSESPEGYGNYDGGVDLRAAVGLILKHLKLRIVKTRAVPAETKIAKELSPDERAKANNQNRAADYPVYANITNQCAQMQRGGQYPQQY